MINVFDEVRGITTDNNGTYDDADMIKAAQ